MGQIHRPVHAQAEEKGRSETMTMETKVMKSTAFDGGSRVPTPAARYSPAVRRGPILAISGQVPFMPGSLLAGEAPPAFEEQVRAVFTNLSNVLESAGASFDDVVMVRVYLAREEDFPVMNAVFNETFTDRFPARTTVWVHLPAGILVEADLLAVVDP